jgi:lysophospholipase L1-like esterase
VLQSRKPGYLLILYGANDIIKGVGPSTTVERLRGIIQAAKANQTIPIIGTVTPAFPWHDYMTPSIEHINPLITSMARAEGARVANTYGALNDETLYQSDGLHHTPEGATALATAFRARL